MASSIDRKPWYNLRLAICIFCLCQHLHTKCSKCLFVVETEFYHNSNSQNKPHWWIMLDQNLLWDYLWRISNMEFLSGLQEQNRRWRKIKELSSSQAIYASSRHTTHAVCCTTVQEGQRLLVGLLTGHNTLNRHLTLQMILCVHSVEKRKIPACIF